MKSEFILAFNEIAETRKLPREVVLDALRAALVSAFRRDAGLSSNQHVEVRIDEQSGKPSIWVEMEVVEDVESENTEVSLTEAHQLYPDVNLGDMVLVERTPEDFGRIAAQTAKQVILQRMREAERDAQYSEYMERVGDLITGTVQSTGGDVVTISLGRAEAILPRSQQVPGERYRMHDKVRAYVMEVKKTNRGPQIVVSRTHRNMLRRLLEYEVPEIYNGTVEIKSIAREPGARSKVAVAALQPGADPVGACVGMRGVRIQSIVKELNGEKIDVIEWNADQAQFISKALSPARVSAVFLDDDPDEGRTATVVVPDDQLSLAIGREGQNARLAAKLTGWRIDIKSVSEAARDALEHVYADAELVDAAGFSPDMVSAMAGIMEKKDANRPIMPEDYQLMVDFVKVVEGQRLSEREDRRIERRAEIEAARAQVPDAAFNLPLEETDLPLRIYNLAVEAGYATAGQLLEQFYRDPDKLLEISGFGPAALKSVEELAESIDTVIAAAEQAQVEEELPEEAEVEAEVAAEAVDETLEETVSAPVEEEAPQPARTAEPQWYDEDEEGRRRRAELAARMAASLDIGIEETPIQPSEEPLPVSEPAEPTGEIGALEPEVVQHEHLVQDEGEFDEGEFDDDELDEDKRDDRRRKDKQRRRELVFDEDLGKVVARRRRKRGDKEWDDLSEIEDVEY